MHDYIIAIILIPVYILLALLGRRLLTFAHGYEKGLEDAEKIKKMKEKADEGKDKRKQLRDLYDEFVRETWSESEDVRGDNMIKTKTARQILSDLLCELGVWDEGEKLEI